MCSTCRLPPVKRVPLARLGLLAALIGTTLLTYACKATTLTTTHATVWTDSTVALAWLRNYPNHRTTFVCNGATVIRTITSPSQWKHCPRQHNPADMVTTGSTPSQLKASNLRSHDPYWVSKEPVHWPCADDTPTDLHVLPDARTTAAHILIVGLPQPVLVPLTSTFPGELTADGLTSAGTYLLRASQVQSFPTDHNVLDNNAPVPDGPKMTTLNPFLDEGIIRVAGRLHLSARKGDEQHPIIRDGDCQ